MFNVSTIPKVYMNLDYAFIVAIKLYFIYVYVVKYFTLNT